jgi:hypothetical protein
VRDSLGKGIAVVHSRTPAFILAGQKATALFAAWDGRRRTEANEGDWG